MSKNKYLFKAKRQNWKELPKDKQWIIGCYQERFDFFGDKEYLIFYTKSNTDWEYAKIDPDTICQCIGTRDKNNNLIWENDIVNIHIFHEIAEGYGKHIKEQGVLCYDKIGMLSLNIDSPNAPCYSDILFQTELAGINMDIEVMGNVFDNPELLNKNNKKDPFENDYEEVELE